MVVVSYWYKNSRIGLWPPRVPIRATSTLKGLYTQQQSKHVSVCLAVNEDVASSGIHNFVVAKYLYAPCPHICQILCSTARHLDRRMNSFAL